jgi:hypothetical protein
MLTNLRTRLANGARNLRTILVILGVAVVFIGGTGSSSGALVRNLAFAGLAVWVLRRVIRSRRRGTRAMREYDAAQPADDSTMKDAPAEDLADAR